MKAWKQAVTRLRTAPGARDQYGERMPGQTVEEPLPDALFAPGGTSEPVAAGSAPVLSSPTLYWPGQWPDITATDRVRVGATTYRVEGRPADWPMGLVATLAAVEPTTQEP